MKTVDLNATKSAIEIKMADKVFKIGRVVTGVWQRYEAFLYDQNDKIAKVTEFSEALQKGEDIDLVTSLSKEVEGFANSKVDRLLEIVELILVKNDIEFDRAWWIDNGDVNDYLQFVVACIQKDYDGGKKKGPEN